MVLSQNWHDLNFRCSAFHHNAKYFRRNIYYINFWEGSIVKWTKFNVFKSFSFWRFYSNWSTYPSIFWYLYDDNFCNSDRSISWCCFELLLSRGIEINSWIIIRCNNRYTNGKRWEISLRRQRNIWGNWRRVNHWRKTSRESERWVIKICEYAWFQLIIIIIIYVNQRKKILLCPVCPGVQYDGSTLFRS